MQQVERRQRVKPSGQYRMLGVRWYSNGCFIRETITNGEIKAQYVYAVEPGDFIYNRLFAWKGSFGIVPQGFRGCFVSNEFPTFRVDGEKLASEYLLLLFSQPHMWKRAATLSTGTTSISRNRLNESDLLALRVVIPTLTEQQTVAEVLRSIELAIQGTASVLDELLRVKHAVMRELLTLGHPAHRTRPVPLAEPWRMGRVAPIVERIPSHWKLATLTKIAKLESGHTPSRQHPEYWNGTIPWLSLPDSYRLEALEVDDADGRISPLGIENSSARMLPVGAVLLIRTGGSRGKCSRLAKTMACSQDYVAFVPGPELDPRYLQQVFRHMQREWQRLSDGSTTLRNIFMHAFKRLKILLPPLGEQSAIAEVGEAFDDRIAAETRYLERLRQTKRGFAQALLSGRVRVAVNKTNGAGANGAARRP